MTLDYLSHLRADSARFAAVLRDAPWDGQVPTCPDWRADDLLWHLGEVQWFWGTVVREDVADPGQLRHPDRPADRAGLLAFFDEASTALQEALARVGPGEPRWTWHEPDRTAGFVRRRQAHEALIHRVDAELTADVARAPLDPALCTDGVDEALRVMFGGAPPWAQVEIDRDATLLVRTTDTGRAWVTMIGTFDGTSPESGTTYSGEPLLDTTDAVPDAAAAATVEGAAADLDCWLWGRPTMGQLDRSGDEQVLTRVQQLVSAGVD